MKNRRVVIGVTGGVAAFKSAALVSQLVQRGADVQVVRTCAAGEFVGDATFAALSGRPVACEVFDSRFPLGAHIEIAREYELLCIAPATAHFLGQAANGLADDLLSTLYLSFRGPILAAPSMNAEMWAKPSVQRNVTRLAEDGVEVVSPESGWLSCRVQGAGRMVEPQILAERIESALGRAFEG
jgi:phosphopantothenoylcysteine decarboxylase/phosphopantothenate--cysteine ligase